MFQKKLSNSMQFLTLKISRITTLPLNAEVNDKSIFSTELTFLGIQNESNMFVYIQLIQFFPNRKHFFTMVVVNDVVTD